VVVAMEAQFMVEATVEAMEAVMLAVITTVTHAGIHAPWVSTGGPGSTGVTRPGTNALTV